MTTPADFRWAFQMMRDAADWLLDRGRTDDPEISTWIELSDDDDHMAAAQHIITELQFIFITPDNLTDEPLHSSGLNLGQLRARLQLPYDGEGPGQMDPIEDLAFSLDLLGLLDDA